VPAADTITLSLISHTNVGKTTLARTLLRRDVGDAADQEHVTDVATAYTLIEAEPHRLLLWDTPGFGSTPKLLKRLRSSDRPLGWFLSAVWDRFRDRALWCSQQAVQNVQSEADVVLYLVNAGENPETTGYVDMEMEILTWIGRPVVLLLNQTGPPRPPGAEAAEEQAWKLHLARFPMVRAVLSLDAFARCWVQEGELMDAVAPLLPDSKHKAFTSLRLAWLQEGITTFHRSMATLATQLACAATDRITVSREKLYQKIGIGRAPLQEEMTLAREELSRRLAARSMQSVDTLIALHGLTGHTARSAITAGSADFGVPSHVSESVWTAVGAALTGAAGGLVADLKTGGMTFGGGTVIGFFAGGTGAWLLAKGLNLTRSDDHSVRWTLEHFIAQVEIALVTYLAVAHFGRGRGSWQDAEHPPHWPPAARTELQQYRSELETAWKKAANPDTTADSLVPEITGTITAATAALLRSLYPDIPMPWLDPANPTPGASSPVAKTVSTHASPQGS
jgi:hypothetical protein